MRPEAATYPRDVRSSDIFSSEAYRRELLQRSLRSTPFAKSERLGALLTFICEMSFKGSADKLNEQRIGCSVFGRAKDYDSSVDGIVRSQASRLRQRLDQYFAEEGRDEPLRISIPRGSYVPLFKEKEVVSHSEVLVEEPLPNSVEGEPDLLPAHSSTLSPRFFRLLPWLLLGVLAAVWGTTWLRGSHLRTEAAVPNKWQDPVLLRFWGGLLAPGPKTLMVMPDSGLVMFENFSGERVDLKNYLDGKYRAGTSGARQEGILPVQPAPMLDLANRRYTSMVDVEAVLHMQDLARLTKSELDVRYARDLRPNDLKTGNAILLGASSANPWVELFEKNMNFVLQDDYIRDRAVVNRHPSNGEPERWAFPHGNPNREVFGVVAYRPNVTGDGNALILEGTSMSGTEAATDFIMDNSEFVPFLSLIGATKDHIPHFEVVLTTNNLGSSAGRPTILAWRKAP